MAPQTTPQCQKTQLTTKLEFIRLYKKTDSLPYIIFCQTQEKLPELIGFYGAWNAVLSALGEPLICFVQFQIDVAAKVTLSENGLVDKWAIASQTHIREKNVKCSLGQLDQKRMPGISLGHELNKITPGMPYNLLSLCFSTVLHI